MGRADRWEGTHVTLHAGRWRRLYAMLVALVLAGAVAWQVWGEPGDEPAPLDAGASVARSAGLDGAGVHQSTLATIVGPDAIRFTEQLTFASPRDEVTLLSPEHPGAASGFAPTIEDLWVDTGTGRRAAEGPAPGSSVVVRLPEPATEVTVGYLAHDVVAPTPGSLTGRALALVTPLRAEGGPGLRAVEVRGVWVDNLGCLDRAGRLSACGTGTPLGWTTEPADVELVDVVAQLTVPSG